MLDRSRPFAEVHGLPGAVYEQDGEYFNSEGGLTVPKYYELDDPQPEEDVYIPGPTCIEQPTLPPDLENGRNLEDMHWRHLKALVETFGGEYENKEQALKFMKGKK